MTGSKSSSVCAIILAAGESKRFGPENKLRVEVEGTAMLERVVKTVTGSGVGEVIVVTGRDQEAMASLLSGYNVKLIQNKDWRKGMGMSLAAAAGFVDEKHYSGILVCLGDLPFLSVELVQQMLDVFHFKEGKRIVVPEWKGRRGHPVIFPVSYRSALMKLRGDRGARAIIAEAADIVEITRVDSPEIIKDIDTPPDLEKKTTP